MAITFGSAVGSADVTGSQSVTVTLTADVDPGDPVTARFILLEVAAKFSGIVGTDDFSVADPDVTISPVLRSGPYYPLLNEIHENIGPPAQGVLIDTGPPTDRGDWLLGVGVHPLLVLSPMKAGDTITLDYTGKTTRTFSKLHVGTRVCEGLNAVGLPFASGIFYGYVYGTKSTSGHLYIPGSSSAPTLPPTFLDGQLMAVACTTIDSENVASSISGGDGVTADFFDTYTATADGRVGFAAYSFGSVPSTAMDYSSSAPARRHTWGMRQLVEGPGIPYPHAIRVMRWH